MKELDVRKLAMKELAVQIISFANKRVAGVPYFFGSSWFEITEYGLKIYIRKSNRRGETIDIVNIDIADSFKGQGLFTSLLDELEQLSPYSLYIENVLNPRLSEFFQKRSGWTTDEDNNILAPACYYYIKQNRKNE